MVRIKMVMVMVREEGKKRTKKRHERISAVKGQKKDVNRC